MICDPVSSCHNQQQPQKLLVIQVPVIGLNGLQSISHVNDNFHIQLLLDLILCHHHHLCPKESL